MIEPGTIPRRPTLVPGERILWQGRPSQGFRFGWMDVPITVFMLVWSGIPTTAAVTTFRQTGTFDVFFLPFLAVGTYMLVGRFFVDIWLRRRTHYVLTDRRALIERHGPWSGSRSIVLGNLADLQFKPSRNGAGTIRFSTGEFSVWNRGNVHAAGLPGTPSFEMIEDAERVYGLVIRAQNGVA